MRLALVGPDGDHGEDLIRIFNVVRRHAGWSVSHVISDGTDRGPELADRFALPLVHEPTSVVNAVDGALILPRDGARHRALAEPFLRAGKAVFVDKPLTASVTEAQQLVTLATECNATLVSGSAMRWLPLIRDLADAAAALDPTSVWASGPVDPHGPYSRGFFYGVHAVELALEVAARLGAGDATRLTPASVTPAGAELVGRSGDLTLKVSLVANADVPFTVQVTGRHGVMGRSVELDDDYMAPLTDVLVDAVRTRRWPLGPDALVAPIHALDEYHRVLDGSPRA